MQTIGPPATVTPLYAPVEGLTGSFSMSTGELLGFSTVTITAVAVPGAGETVPLTIICADPL